MVVVVLATVDVVVDGAARDSAESVVTGTVVPDTPATGAVVVTAVSAALTERAPHEAVAAAIATTANVRAAMRLRAWARTCP